MKRMALLFFYLFPLSFVPLAAQQSFSARFLDGRITSLEIFAPDGGLQQQIRYHYSLHGGVWYPSADIVSNYEHGSETPSSYAGTHYDYRDTLGAFRLAELTTIATDGARLRSRYSYSPDGTLASVRVAGNDIPLYEVEFGGDSLELAANRKLDRLQSRRVAPDPQEQRSRLEKALSLCGKDSSLVLSPVSGECFLFDSEGHYLSRVHLEGHDNELVQWQGEGRELLTARFADGEEDPASLYLGTKVVRVSDEDVSGSLQVSDAYNPSHRGLFKGCFFLARHSGYGGDLDFAANGRHGILYDGLYITQTRKDGRVAHNNFNYGNFLWGAAARAVGVPLWIARLGSHFNNFFLSPDTRGTFDAPDDQFSIGCGHHFWSERQ